MNRTLSTCRTIGTRLISTGPVSKNSTATVEVETQKDSYYKNLGIKNEIRADDVKPEGWDEARPYKSIPGPKPLPIIGNVWRYFPYIGEFHNINVLDLHKTFYRRYGNISAIKGIPGVKDTVLIFRPEDFELMHRNEGVFPIRDALKAYAHYRTVVRKDLFQGVGGVTTVQGIDWYNFRSKVNPILMQPRTALQYIDSMNLIANEFLQYIQKFTKTCPNGDMPDDFINYIYRWALESITYVALDKRLGCLDPKLQSTSEQQKIIDSVTKMFYLYYKVEVLPSLWKVFPTKSWKEFVSVLDTMTYTFLKYINEAKKRFAEEGDPEDVTKMNVLQRLLKADKKVALAMGMDLLTAGVDTTGRTAGAAFYFLATNPSAQEKLRAEMQSLLPSKDDPVSKEVLTDATYLKAVIKETTRLAPISVGNFRQAIKDMVIQGYQIPKGTNILSSNLVLCHSEEHFPRAMEFIPDRWLRTTEGELSHKNTHPFVYLPFGFGPRSCIGKRLANLELEILIARVIRNFSLEWHHGEMEFTSYPLYGVASPLKLRFKELEK